MKLMKSFYRYHFWAALLCLGLCLIFSSNGWAGPQAQEMDLPAPAEAGLKYLLDLVHRPDAAFEAQKVAPLLEFTRRNLEAHLSINSRASGSGGSVGIEIDAPLAQVLAYAYNPRIPNFLVSPNTLRVCGWYPQSDILTRKPRLWEKRPAPGQPILLRGRAFEVNTPDPSTGAYYRYDLLRLVILMTYQNRTALISVSKMPHPSQVGKKAVILDDENWNYFYSGIKGLNLPIIGSADTYLYDSESVLIYTETESSPLKSGLRFFKWLKAGWSGINMVKPEHIEKGGERFLKGFKQVIESAALPAAPVLAQKLEQIGRFSDSEIEARISTYARNFEQLAKTHKEMDNRDFARIIADGGYWQVLTRGEQMAVLKLECLKRELGKPALLGPASPKGVRQALHTPKKRKVRIIN